MKFFFYYNRHDGVIEEATLAMANQQNFAASPPLVLDPNTGRVQAPASIDGIGNNIQGERHAWDVSTFLPLCVIYDNDSNFIESAKYSTNYRFSMWPGAGINIYANKQFLTVYHNGSTTDANGITTYQSFGDYNTAALENDDFGGGSICEMMFNAGDQTVDLQWMMVTDNTYFLRYTNPTRISGDDIKPFSDFDNDGGSGNPNDGVSQSSQNNSRQSNNMFVPWDGLDAKIMFQLGSNIILEEGWYAIDIPLIDEGKAWNHNTNTFSAGYNVVDGLTGIIPDSIDRANGDDGEERRWGFANGATWVTSNVSNDSIISSTASYNSSNNTLTFEQVLDEEYTYYTPQHSNTMGVERKVGYVIWRDDGATEQIVHHGIETLTLSNANGGTVTVDSATKRGSFEVNYTPTTGGNYKIQFIPHEDTYRFAFGELGVNVSSTPQAYDKISNYYELLINSTDFATRDSTVTTVTDSDGDEFTLQTIEQSNSVQVSWADCVPTSDEDKWYFEVNASGEIVTHAVAVVSVSPLITTRTSRAIKNCVGDTKRFESWSLDSSNGYGFYCDSEWNGRVYRKLTNGVGDEWVDVDDFCNNVTQDPNEFIDVRVTGWGTASALIPGASLIVKDTAGTPLPAGVYGVCLDNVNDVDSATGRLSYPVANSNLDVTHSISENTNGTKDITFTITSSGSEEDCWRGNEFHIEYVDQDGTVTQVTMTPSLSAAAPVSATSQAITLNSGTWTIKVYTGWEIGIPPIGTSPNNHEGIPNGTKVYEITGVEVPNWCDDEDENKSYIEVDNQGRIISNDGFETGRISCATGGIAQYFPGGADRFYCNVDFDLIRKSDGTPWLSSGALCETEPDVGETITTKLTGTGDVNKGYLIVKDQNGIALPAGFYGICDGALPGTNVDFNLSVNDNNDKTFNLTASVNYSATHPNDCLDGINSYFEVVDSLNNNAVIQTIGVTYAQDSGASQYTTATETTQTLSGGEYFFRLVHGGLTSVSAPILFEGINDDVVILASNVYSVSSLVIDDVTVTGCEIEVQLSGGQPNGSGSWAVEGYHNNTTLGPEQYLVDGVEQAGGLFSFDANGEVTITAVVPYTGLSVGWQINYIEEYVGGQQFQISDSRIGTTLSIAPYCSGNIGYIEVSKGVVTLHEMNLRSCDDENTGSIISETNFTPGYYCDVDITLVRRPDGTAFGPESDYLGSYCNVCSGTPFSAKLRGYASAPNSEGVFVSGTEFYRHGLYVYDASNTPNESLTLNDYLADGYYLICDVPTKTETDPVDGLSYTSPDIDALAVVPTLTLEQGISCDDDLFFFYVNENGVISTYAYNSADTLGDRIHAMVLFGVEPSSRVRGQLGGMDDMWSLSTRFMEGSHHIYHTDITLYKPTDANSYFDIPSVQGLCGGFEPINVHLRGSTEGRTTNHPNGNITYYEDELKLYKNFTNSEMLEAGWYVWCGSYSGSTLGDRYEQSLDIESTGEVCSYTLEGSITPRENSTSASLGHGEPYFIRIEADGSWDGNLLRIDPFDGELEPIYNIASEGVYDEQYWPMDNGQSRVSLWTKSDGQPWAVNSDPNDPTLGVPAFIFSDDEIALLNNSSGDGVIYVDGILGEGYKLKVYKDPGEPILQEGYYLTSCFPDFFSGNGVREEKLFDCYGNPFVWYSTKNESGYVKDEKNYLTNGTTPWYNDAPLKDLTATGCDLAVAGWNKAGDAGGTTLLVDDYIPTNPIENCSVDADIIDFDVSSPYLTRSGDYWYPNPETGQKIISSYKSSATEMTIAVVVHCESYGTIFKITDVSTREGAGQYDKLDDLSAVLSTIKLEKVAPGNETFPKYVLTTERNDFSTTSSNTISADSSYSGSRYEIVIIKLATDGHYLRVNALQPVTDYIPSNFCSDVGGITNFNVEIGADKDVEDSAVDMNFAEMIIYDEELNYDEIIELEGYLSHKWCEYLSDASHDYYASGPVCGVCEDKCCESDISLSTVIAEVSGALRMTCSYKSSENVSGYQFKISGLEAMGLQVGFYEDGDSIDTSDGSSYLLDFSESLGIGFKYYLEVTQSGVWVFAHVNEVLSDGDFRLFPKTDTLIEFVEVRLSLQTGTPPSWGSVVPKIVVSEAGFNSPQAPHPLIVSYDANSGLSPSAKYKPDVNGDGQIDRLDAEEIVKRISGSHDSGPYDLSGNSWLETIDARAKGWVDISDAVTCLLNIVNQRGTHLGDPIPSIGTEKPLTLMSNPICSDRLKEMECLPCPCPEEVEEDECLQRVWISDIEPADDSGQFGIVTVMYQSNCCIDGYKLVLGGFNDKVINSSNGSGYHEGVIMAPSYGNSIGQLTDESETHLRGWLHGITLNPEYDGEVAVLNTSELFTINNNLYGDYNVATQLSVENSLLFPIVWGMSLGQNPQLPTTAAGKVERAEQLESGRLGINCIPATCKGESRVLTKFVINLRSFINPHISEFRLVTNDKAVTPCSFDSGDTSICSNITWTGDINDNGQVNGSDLFTCLVLMYTGWSVTTNWSSSLNDPEGGQTDGPFTAQIKKLNSEFDLSYIDIVDGLTQINHIIMKGQDALTDKQAEIVPTDCCPCELPGDFTVSLDVNPCDCAEEGYVAGQEGYVTVTWTESTTASSYEVYRVIEEIPNNSPSYNPFDPFNTSIKNIEPSLLEASFDNNLLMSVKTVAQSGSTISDNDIVSLYKEKIRASKNPLDYSKWVKVYSGLPETTTFIDRNPPIFKNCCPDDEMPSVKYIVVALNDCGEKNAVKSYIPECCGHKPVARDVDLGQLSVNSVTPLYSDAYHPFALNPYGGLNTKATAQIVLNAAPSIDTTIKLISWDGTVSTYTIAQGQASPTAAAQNLVDAIEAADAGITASISSVSDGAIDLEQDQPTICGNTKITVVSGDLAAVVADEKFTGGNVQCNPVSEDCEDLAFFITSVTYSSPHNGDALFVGPSGGGQLPTGNLVGLWTWKPPSNYIGGVRFTYVVVNESGCSDEATISVNYAPPKLILDCYSPPCDSNKYGKVFLKLRLPNNDNLAQFVVLRKPSSVSDWDMENHAIKDEDNNYIKFDVTDYPDDIFEFVDENVPMPDECCEDDLSYDYVIYYCESSSLKVGDKKTAAYSTSVALVSSTDYVCVLSTVCTVVIPCCGPPHNVLPTASVTDCVESKYSTVVLTWDGSVNDSDNPYLYIVFRRKSGEEKWTKISEIDATLDGRNDSNPNWDSGSSLYRFEENIYTNNRCDDDQDYEYAIVTIDLNKKASGNPEDTDWANIEDGSPCSPGGLTVPVTVESCPPALCAEDKTLQVCIDENYEYDLRKFVDCVPTSASGEDVSVSYSINAQAGLTNPAQIDGSNLVFNTRNIASEGTATVTITASTGAPCVSTVDFIITLNLVDCGCPCPEDEADYTICDNNYINEEYASNDTTANELIGKLENTEQAPFSLTTKGGQTLRKGQPYVVSKGKIDCD